MSEQSIPAPVIYKEVNGYPRYRVGSDGTVWFRRGKSHGYQWQEMRWRNTSQRTATGKRCGYRRVSLCRYGIRKHFLVHHLVLLAFVGPRPEGTECCHRDGNHSNNCLENLYWGTHEQNLMDSMRLGSIPRGDDHWNAKLTTEIVIRIKQMLAMNMKKSDIARRLGLTWDNVDHVAQGRAWRHVVFDEKGAVV